MTTTNCEYNTETADIFFNLFSNKNKVLPKENNLDLLNKNNRGL